MQKILFLFSFLIMCFSVKAQSIKFEGLITDSKAVGLEMANVMAVNQATKAMDSYSITNDKGKFQLKLNANTAYTIKVSYIGFKPLELTINTTTENVTKILTLEAGEELNEVEIVREMPVSIKGDTIVYNADSFKSGTERKLEDILKKLPGVEVNADGEVEVEGKKVTKLMVEGKDFFDGDTKLGVKNIPADAIDKVQVLRNYNEIGALKGLENNEESVAMNIKLKEGKKNFWFGDMTAGIGVGHKEDRHIINPKLFYYNPEFSINILANFNNIGELPLTVQDYFKFTGGFRNIMGKGGSSFNVSSNDLGISLLRNNRAKEIKTDFGATNFSYSPTKAWTLSGFVILSSSTTELETKSKTTYLESGDRSNTDQSALQKNSLGLFKLSSSYKPTTKFQWDYDVIAKLSKQDEDNNLFRQIISSNPSEENIFTAKKQTPTSVKQNASMYYTQSDKNVFAFEMQHLYQDEDPFYNANQRQNPFPQLGLQGNQQRYDLSQTRFVQTNKIDAKLDYYYMVTPKSNINVTLGNTYSHQNFDSHIFQMLDNGEKNDLNEASQNNNVTYNFNDAFVGLHYKILTGKFTFTPGVSIHTYSMNNRQLGTDAKQRFSRVLPDFYALYQIKKSETLTYTFTYTNDFTDINQLIDGYIFSGYSSLFRGNRYLENATSQMHSLRYFKFNMFNAENISANLSYSRKMDAVRSNVLFDEQTNRFSTPYNSNFPDQTVSAYVNYGRSFLVNYKASVNAGLNWSKSNNIQNVTTPADTVDDTPGVADVISVRTQAESFVQNYTVKAATNYKRLPNIEVGYNVMINKYDNNLSNGVASNFNNNNNATFYTEKPFVKVDYFFLKSFSFVSEYEFYNYHNSAGTISNKYEFLSASLIYQRTKDSKWEYKVAATNLLNTTSLNDDSFDQFSTTTSQYVVQPRYIIFSMKYNL